MYNFKQYCYTKLTYAQTTIIKLPQKHNDYYSPNSADVKMALILVSVQHHSSHNVIINSYASHSHVTVVTFSIFYIFHFSGHLVRCPKSEPLGIVIAGFLTGCTPCLQSTIQKHGRL